MPGRRLRPPGASEQVRGQSCGEQATGKGIPTGASTAGALRIFAHGGDSDAEPILAVGPDGPRYRSSALRSDARCLLRQPR